ncbi:MAG: type IV secretory system conjugative DNA transfer family protein [Succinivibrionaceae bacterium]|nr:type IV secretory system conjugative DNA transfer family protein [Succinivibrionaceae bacterium]
MKLKDIQQQLQRYKKPILWVLAVIALVAFTGLFEYIGGKIIYAVYDISQEPHWNTAWHYLQRYGHSQNKRLKLLVWFAALLPLIVLTAGGLLIALSQKQRALFGDARFATMAEVRQAGLLPDKDHRDETILVGKFKGQYLRYGGYQFVMLAAPTRSGKGVGIVIPNCITYTGSLVVLDIKLENFDITAGYRQKALGQKVYLFAPFDPNGRTHRWNPISYISEDPSNRMGDIDAIANALYNNPNAKDPFWDNMAKDMFRACCLAVIETPENLKPHTLGQIIREASAGIDNLKFLLDARVALAYEDGHIKRYGKGDKKEGQAIEVREAGPQPAPKEGEGQNILLDSKGKRVIMQPEKEFAGNQETEQEKDLRKKDREEPPHYYYDDACRRAIKRMTDMPEQTFGSVKSSFQSPLLAFENPRVDAATSANDFDLRDVRRKQMTIYLGITPDKLAEAAVIVNLFFDQLLNQNTRTLPKQDKSLQYQCLMILDEFTAIGKVNMIAKSISYQAGYNMRVLTIIQNKSQLEDVYGKSGAVTLMSNHALMIMYAPSPVVQSDAKEYSEMLGDTTVKSKSKSHSYSKQSSHSDSVSDQKRALMLPQEIKEIGRWREIVSLENCKPIFCDKIKYFEDPDFTDKINWKLRDNTVPVIDVNDFLAELQGRMRPVTADDKDPNKLAGANRVPVHNPDDSDLNDAMSAFGAMYNQDKTLTTAGEQQVADEMSRELIHDRNGHAMGAEGIKKLDLSMGRMNNDRLRRMTQALKSSGNDEDAAVDASELPGTPAPAAEPESDVAETESKATEGQAVPDDDDMEKYFGNSKNDEATGSGTAPVQLEQSDEDDADSIFGNPSFDPDGLSSEELSEISRDKDDSESEETNG